jgi:3-oxoacyl-[acyl-carrier protein] reductase
MTAGHTAIVTGANHGIGAATAQALARRGCAVLCTYLRLDDPEDPGIPQAHRDRRAQGADAVAGVVDWLASDAAALVTGNVLRLR